MMKRFGLAPALGLLVFAAPASAELKGDPEAIRLADQLVESIGGHEVWANTRTLYVIEKSRNPNYGDGLISIFWRDLEVPQSTYSVQNQRITYQKGWTKDGVWVINSRGELIRPDEEDLAAELSYWPGEIYVMYHRLAKGDETIRLEKGEDPRSFVAFHAESGNKLGTFWLNVDGDMYRWRHGNEEDRTEYIYGPHKQFGEISFPAWGTMYDGSWSFEYVEVRGYTEDQDVDYKIPPERN